jgi:hypothetical protein
LKEKNNVHMPNIFINHSSIDRAYPGQEPPPNWVRDFSLALEPYVKQYTGIRYKVWFDERDLTGVTIDQKIIDALNDSHFLLALISPSYLEDEMKYVSQERDYFIKNVIGDETKVENKIIAALRLFDDDDVAELPSVLKNQFRFRLFKFKNINGKDIPEPITKDDPEWKDHLMSIAHSIKQALKKAKSQSQERITIFISATDQLYDERIRLVSEFDSADVSFIVVNPNIKNVDKWKTDLREAYSKCKVALHLFGPAFESRIDDKSIEQFEWEQAVDFIQRQPLKAVNFKVISWIPNTLTNIDEKQQKLIDVVKQENRVLNQHVDYQDKSLEQFKISLKELIEKLKEK